MTSLHLFICALYIFIGWLFYTMPTKKKIHKD
jgi:hypothetical protein